MAQYKIPVLGDGDIVELGGITESNGICKFKLSDLPEKTTLNDFDKLLVYNPTNGFQFVEIWRLSI